MRTISTKLLLFVYAVIPLALAFVLVDHFLLGGKWGAVLPRHPEQLFWYMLIFNLPHIIASYFSFADKEYVSYYSKRLAIGLPIILGLAFLLPWASVTWSVIVLVVYTLYHNVSQQTGVTSMLMKYRDKQVTLWRYVNIVLGIFLYILVYPTIFTRAATPYAYWVTGILLAISCLLTIFITRKSTTREGVWYAWGTTSIAGVGAIALFLGYPIFTITILRIVHDITAFIFYITHDMNRNQETMHNMLYRFALPSPKLFTVGIPLWGILLTYIIQGGGTSTLLQAFFFLAVTHFYIEGFMWKNGTPHRANIALAYAPQKTP